MPIFVIEADEHGVRSLVKNIIDEYEKEFYVKGSYESALLYVQDLTIETMKKDEFQILDNPDGTLH